MPRYLIPVAKPFAPVLNLGEDLLFGSYYYSPITRKSKLELIERSGSNTGNFAFIESVIKQLGADSVAHQADVESMDPGFIREHFDRVVVPSSNFIASKSSGFLEGALVSKLKEWGLPFVIVGLGTQLNADQHISKELLKGLRFISENSASIGVRGNFTAEFLHGHGIDNVDVIGCPSAFWRLNEEFEIDVDRKSLEKPALVNSEINLNSVVCMIDRLREGDMAVLQNEPLFFNNRNSGLLDFEVMNKHIGVTRQQFNRYNRAYYRQSKIFFNLKDWMEFAKDFAFCCGPRFHGNMVALQAGVPAMWLVHDERTSELVEYLGLPSIDSKAAEKMSLADLYARVSLDKFKSGFGEKYRSYKAFLEKNGVEHRL